MWPGRPERQARRAPARHGLGRCARPCGNGRTVPVVVLSGGSDPVIRQEGLRLGAKDFLDKHKLGKEQIIGVLCHATKLQIAE